MKRRYFVLGLGAAGVTAAAVLKPRDVGAPYNAYFRRLNETLKKEGPFRPALIVDLDKLDKNIEALRQIVPDRMGYRVVAKSLPCPELLRYVMRKTGTRRMMVFHQPFLNQNAIEFPEADVLLGKPMPVGAAATFYRELDTSATTFDPQRQVQWLIDTEERLAQYQQLAAALGVRMRINIELDVGLHRGGLQSPEQLEPLMRGILGAPAHLELAGFTGYDPHVVKLPSMIKPPREAYQESQAIYRSFIDWVGQRHRNIDLKSLCLNGAGSPSMAMHGEDSVINDLAAGSCLVKPTDFDIPTLESFQPAAYIATPVLKKQEGVKLPGIESLQAVAPKWNPNWQQTWFIYGGNWMARFESPSGLRGNGLFGASSNQEIVNGSRAATLSIDDHVFLRPTQSEAVFLQFGDILAQRNGKLTARWPVMQG